MPTACVPKFSVEGDSTALGARTVGPISVTACGLVPASSVIVSRPPLPGVCGTNVTVTVQDAPTAIDVPQSLLSEKFPLATTLVMTTGTWPLFVNVTGCVAPAVTFGANVTAVVDTVSVDEFAGVVVVVVDVVGLVGLDDPHAMSAVAVAIADENSTAAASFVGKP